MHFLLVLANSRTNYFQRDEDFVERNGIIKGIRGGKSEARHEMKLSLFRRTH